MAELPIQAQTWLDEITPAGWRPPSGAVDAHTHVFGPEARFPVSLKARYRPRDATADRLFDLRDRLGFSRTVIVQASCYGDDNRAMLDAVARSAGRARGVAVVDPAISDAELAALHDGGVRGVRFNFLKRLADPPPLDLLLALAGRIDRLGWHVVIYFEPEAMDELRGFLGDLPSIGVIDHLGRPDIAQGPGGRDLEALCDLLDANPRLWIKVSGAERLSPVGPPYDDFVQAVGPLVSRYSNRVLWGTDWPHPNMEHRIPDDGALVRMLARLAPTAELRRKLLIDNPLRLYWPEMTS